MVSPHDTLPGTGITRKKFGKAIERAIFPNGDAGEPNHAFLTQEPETKKFRVSQTDTLARAAKALKGEPFTDPKGAPTQHTQAGNGLFLLPPRTGKTVTFGTLVARWQKSLPMKVCAVLF